MDMVWNINIIVDVLCDVKCCCSETEFMSLCRREFVSKLSRSRIRCVNKASLRRTPELDEQLIIDVMINITYSVYAE